MRELSWKRRGKLVGKPEVRNGGKRRSEKLVSRSVTTKRPCEISWPSVPWAFSCENVIAASVCIHQCSQDDRISMAVVISSTPKQAGRPHIVIVTDCYAMSSLQVSPLLSFAENFFLPRESVLVTFLRSVLIISTWNIFVSQVRLKRNYRYKCHIIQ